MWRLAVFYFFLLLNSSIVFGQSVTPVSDSGRKVSKSLLITEKDSERVFVLKKNGLLTIKLNENPSTGAKWRFVQNIDTLLFVEKKSYFKSHSTKAPTPGVGGYRFWIYKAVKPGNNLIEMHYGRPGQDAVWEKVVFRINIIEN